MWSYILRLLTCECLCTSTASALLLDQREMWNPGHLQCLKQRDESKKTRAFHPPGDVLILPVCSAAAHHYELFLFNFFFRSVEGNFCCPLRPPQGFLTGVHFCLPNAAMAQMGRRKVFSLIFSLLTLDGELVPQQGGPRAKGPAPSSTLKGFSVPGTLWCHQLLRPRRPREMMKSTLGRNHFR